MLSTHNLNPFHTLRLGQAFPDRIGLLVELHCLPICDLRLPCIHPRCQCRRATLVEFAKRRWIYSLTMFL